MMEQGTFFHPAADNILTLVVTGPGPLGLLVQAWPFSTGGAHLEAPSKSTG